MANLSLNFIWHVMKVQLKRQPKYMQIIYLRFLMKKDRLYNCIGEIDDNLIMETEQVIQKRNRNKIIYKRLASIACALIVIIGISML